MQERISWELDSSGKHAQGHKERAKKCPISHLQIKKKKALEIDDDLGMNTYEGKPDTSRRVAR